MKAYLRVIEGPAQGQLHILPDGGTRLIGRSGDADWTLEDTQVSRHHCAVWLRQGMVYIRDLQSRNGTLLNQDILEPLAHTSVEHPMPDDRIWQPGERLHIGSSDIELVLEDQPDAARPPLMLDSDEMHDVGEKEAADEANAQADIPAKKAAAEPVKATKDDDELRIALKKENEEPQNKIKVAQSIGTQGGISSLVYKNVGKSADESQKAVQRAVESVHETEEPQRITLKHNGENEPRTDVESTSAQSAAPQGGFKIAAKASPKIGLATSSNLDAAIKKAVNQDEKERMEEAQAEAEKAAQATREAEAAAAEAQKAPAESAAPKIKLNIKGGEKIKLKTAEPEAPAVTASQSVPGIKVAARATVLGNDALKNRDFSNVRKSQTISRSSLGAMLETNSSIEAGMIERNATHSRIMSTDSIHAPEDGHKKLLLRRSTNMHSDLNAAAAAAASAAVSASHPRIRLNSTTASNSNLNRASAAAVQQQAQEEIQQEEQQQANNAPAGKRKLILKRK